MLLHGERLATHGSGEGLRDEGLLDSALARPLNLVAMQTLLPTGCACMPIKNPANKALAQ